MKLELELTEKQLIALAMLMGVGKRASSDPSTGIGGIWKYLKPINDQLRAQLKGEAHLIAEVVERED